jgi:hypothetical protein
MKPLKSRLFAALAGVLALQPLAASLASAEPWRRGGFGGYHRPYGPPPGAYGYGRPGPRFDHRRDHTGRAVGAAVVGIGALIVGAAIADAARRERQRAYVRDTAPHYEAPPYDGRYDERYDSRYDD